MRHGPTRQGIAVAAITAATVVSMFAASSAQATFSLVGADRSTKQVGIALASCAAFLNVDVQKEVYSYAPGKGAVSGQSFYFDNRRNEIAYYLAGGNSPQGIINTLVDVNITRPNKSAPLYERKFGDAEGAKLLQRRQYLVTSTATGQAPAGFTGNSNEAVVGTPPARTNTSASSPDSRFQAALGGNTLTSTGVVTAMKQQWLSQTPIVAQLERLLGTDIPPAVEAKLKKGDLAERLFMAITAGGSNGGGDNRCTPTGKSSDVSYLRVDEPTGRPSINLKWRSTTGGDALKALAQRYLACRGYNTGCIDS